MRDYLTVLTHNSLILAKQWQADGTIKGYDKPKHFSVREAEVKGIEELSALLTELEKDKHSCVIRGGLKASNSTGLKKVRRIKAGFDDAPHRWMLIEVDKYQPLTADPVMGAEAACREYIECCLPVNFHQASFHWQLSGSAGHASKAGFLKAHIWFWLSEPRDSLSLREWAEGKGIECDKAVFDEIQVHYTAAPVMVRGTADPVPRRSGLWRGERDSVDAGEISLGDRQKSTDGKERVSGDFRNVEDEFSLALKARGLARGRGRDGSVHIECPWVAGHSMKGGDNETVYWPAGTGGYELGHFDCRHDGCRRREDGDFIEALGLMDDEFEPLVSDLAPDMPEAKKETLIHKPLARKLKNNEEGKSLACLENLDLVLSNPHLCGKDIRFDTFRDEIVWRAVDDKGNVVGGGKWLSFKDADYTSLRLYLGITGFLPISREMMRDAVHHAAHHRLVDTAIEWLEPLEWDGAPRVDAYLRDCLGADDTPYCKAVSRYIWAAMAGRILEPGCKADAAPIFIGEQDIGKSRAIAAMVPDMRWFAEIKLDDNEDNLSRKMRGKAVMEFAEMRGLHTKEMEGIKAFITRQYEEWVPKFMEFTTLYPRRGIFIGTSNKDEIFADETGNRRWFPVTVTFADIEKIVSERNQLWAEGKIIYRREGLKNIYEKANMLAKPIRESFEIIDEWQEIVLSWIRENEKHDEQPIQVKTILNHALLIENRHIQRKDELRIGRILRKNGYKKTDRRVNGIISKIWVR